MCKWGGGSVDILKISNILDVTDPSDRLKRHECVHHCWWKRHWVQFNSILGWCHFPPISKHFWFLPISLIFRISHISLIFLRHQSDLEVYWIFFEKSISHLMQNLEHIMHLGRILLSFDSTATQSQKNPFFCTNRSQVKGVVWKRRSARDDFECFLR